MIYKKQGVSISIYKKTHDIDLDHRLKLFLMGQNIVDTGEENVTQIPKNNLIYCWWFIPFFP